MDLIDRQALLKQIDIDSDGEPGYYGDTWKFIDTIKSMPSVTDKNVGTKLGTNLAQLGADCISRQQAVDAIDEQIEQCNKALGSFDISPKDEYAIKVERASLEAYKEQLENMLSAQPEPCWIPVSERMPELDEDGYSEKVLVCFDRVSFCEICEYRTDKWYIGDMEDSPEDIGLRVTAWMPLPEPYRGGGKE